MSAPKRTTGPMWIDRIPMPNGQTELRLCVLAGRDPIPRTLAIIYDEAIAPLLEVAPDLLEALKDASAQLSDVRLIIERGADFQTGRTGKHRDLVRILREADILARAARSVLAARSTGIA